MRRFLATVLMAAVGTTAVGVGIALAADIEITPAVSEPGEARLTIEVTGFEPDTPIYAVPCAIPVDGTELDVTTDNCDVAMVVTTVTDADGNATIVADWDIPAEGVAVYVGDEARDREVVEIITPEVDADADDSPEVAVLGTNVVQEPDLADTGPREVMLLVTAATVLIGVGIAFRGAERRLLPA